MILLLYLCVETLINIYIRQPIAKVTLFLTLIELLLIYLKKKCFINTSIQNVCYVFELSYHVFWQSATAKLIIGFGKIDYNLANVYVLIKVMHKYKLEHIYNTFSCWYYNTSI